MGGTKRDDIVYAHILSRKGCSIGYNGGHCSTHIMPRCLQKNYWFHSVSCSNQLQWKSSCAAEEYTSIWRPSNTLCQVFYRLLYAYSPALQLSDSEAWENRPTESSSTYHRADNSNVRKTKQGSLWKSREVYFSLMLMLMLLQGRYQNPLMVHWQATIPGRKPSWRFSVIHPPSSWDWNTVT